MAGTGSRKSIVTPENAEESRRLRAIWDRTKERREASGVGSQEAFGLKYGIGNQAAVHFFLNGKAAISLKAAAAFARGLGCEVADFSPRLAELLRGPAAGVWPFSRLTRAEWERIDAVERAIAEDAYLGKLSELRAEREGSGWNVIRLGRPARDDGSSLHRNAPQKHDRRRGDRRRQEQTPPPDQIGGKKNP